MLGWNILLKGLEGKIHTIFLSRSDPEVSHQLATYMYNSKNILTIAIVLSSVLVLHCIDDIASDMRSHSGIWHT